MADIFNILNNPVANLPKEGFDLSQYSPYSLKLGQVVPIGYVHTVPGSDYKIDFSELCHTEPFKTDAFVRLSKHIEVAFIPYSQLWRPASEFFAQSNDKQSSYEQGHTFVPNISLGKILRLIWHCMSTPVGSLTPLEVDMLGFNAGQNALRLLDMLGFGAFPLWQMTDNDRSALFTQYDSKRINIFALLAYQKYWNVYLRDAQHTSNLAPSAFNVDKVPCTSEATSHIEDYYSDAELMQILQIRYRKTKRDLFTSSLTSRQFGAVEVVSVNMDSLSASVSGNGGIIGALASNQTNDNEPYFNYGDLGINDTQNLMWSAVVSPQSTGQIGAMSSGGTKVDLKHKHKFAKTVYSTDGVIEGLSVSVNSGNGGFDVYTLLTAQLMQKWKEQIQRAGNKTDSRLRAVYGSVPKSDAVNSPYIIGATSYDILSQQVTATGASTGVNLGDIAAKGMGYSQRNNFDFHATEFGVIIAFTYLLPENNYFAPLDKLNTLIDPFDFWVPQLQNLGLEGIQHIHQESIRYNSTTDKYEKVPDSELDSIDGYAARDWKYKTKVDVVHLGFGHGQSNAMWCPSKRLYRPDISGFPAALVNTKYYINPNEFDTLFGTVADEKIDTDAFICSLAMKCYAVQPMSALGLPRW